MIEVHGDLWATSAPVIAIPTNGSLKLNRCAVMGAGVAKQAAERCPGIDAYLGSLILNRGNHVAFIGCWNAKVLYSFPTKHNAHDYVADVELIRRSCIELRTAEAGSVALPRPGCLNGHLQWAGVVRPILERELPEPRFIVTDLACPPPAPAGVDLSQYTVMRLLAASGRVVDLNTARDVGSHASAAYRRAHRGESPPKTKEWHPGLGGYVEVSSYPPPLGPEIVARAYSDVAEMRAFQAPPFQAPPSPAS